MQAKRDLTTSSNEKGVNEFDSAALRDDEIVLRFVNDLGLSFDICNAWQLLPVAETKKRKAALMRGAHPILARNGLCRCL